MKNIHTKEEFLLIKEGNLNEGLFGFLKNLVKGIGKLFGKVKGGKELQQKIKDYEDKIDKIFVGLTSAEQSKTALNKNAQLSVESKIYEENGAEGEVKDNAADGRQGQPGNGQELQPKAQNVQKTAQGGEKNLDSNQLKGKINVSKEHIKQLRISFNNEVDALKKKFTDKDGKVSKKLEYSILLSKSQLSDYIFQKWEEHYTQIGDKKTISNIQKQRAEIAKEMKTNTQALQQLIEGGDKEKRTFEVDKKYSYTNSEGKEVEITVKEIDNNGDVKSAELVKSDGETVTINPYTDKIGNKVEDETQAQPKVQPQKVQAQPKAQAQAQPKTQA